jgi:hypothetical protein
MAFEVRPNLNSIEQLDDEGLNLHFVQVRTNCEQPLK